MGIDHSEGGESSSNHMFNVNWVDAALGYYDILGRQETKRATSSDLVDDDYSQMEFFPASRSSSLVAVPGLASAKSKVGALHGHVTHKLQKLRARYRELQRASPKRTLLIDKAAFLLGVFHICSSAYWLGSSPSTFYQLYTGKAIFLFALRFYLYRKEKMHYYLLDFCYYANVLHAVQVWFFPESCSLQKILFAFSMGPLAWSIVAFRNSMIFHSLDKMTSVFLHAFPALVAWTGRWHSGDPNHWKGPQENACQGENAIATVRELILVPWVPYALWAVAYYLKIFVVSSQRIQDRGYHTLFKYTTRKPNSLAGKVVSKLPRWVAPLAFMANHVLFCAVTFALAWLMWSHYWINTLFLIWCIAMSAWNGGNYYFEVFAHQYATETGISKPVKGSKPAQGGAVADGAQPRPHSIDGTSSRTSAGAEVKGVMRSQSDGALTTEDLVEEMEYLEQQMTQWEEQQMNGDASMSGASAEGGVSRGDLSVASHPAGDEDVDPSVFAKVNSYPVNSIELPVTPGDDNAGALDDGVIRRRAGAEQSGVGGAAG